MTNPSDALPFPDPGAPAPLPPPEPPAALPAPETPEPLEPADAPGGAQPRAPLTRRQLLVGLAAGGALVATNAGTGLITERISTTLAERRAQVKIDELEGQVSRLERQLALYGDMERIGLDKLIRAVLEAYDRFWPPVRSAVGVLLGALRSIEDGLTHFELKLPTLRSASSVLAGLLTGLEAQIQSAQDGLNDLLKRTGPIGEAVSGFLTWLLNRNPFGLTSAARDAADRLSALVAGIPPLIADMRKRILGPLDDEWLANTTGQGVQGLLFDPLRTNLITPLRTHLEEMDQAAANWVEQAKPLRAALEQRDKIRAEIARLERAGSLAGAPRSARG